MSVNDILDDSPNPLIEWASQCRQDEELRGIVKDFLRQTKIARVLSEVIKRSGVSTDREATAEVLFAYGAMALTAMAATNLAVMRADLIKSGHPDCSKGEPCPTSGGKCDKMACPFYEGLHPIVHVEAIVSQDEAEESEKSKFGIDDMVRFALSKGVAEA